MIRSNTILIEAIVGFGFFNDVILQKLSVLLQLVIFETCANLKDRRKGRERERDQECPRDASSFKAVAQKNLNRPYR